MRVTTSLQHIVYRISRALAYIPGVACAPPPYHAPLGAFVGHGVTVHDDGGHVVFTCYVVVDAQSRDPLPAQCVLIQAVARSVIATEYTQDVRIDVVVTAIDFKGTHASHRPD